MSSSPQISRIGVIGAGFMGSGIAETCAVAGVDVTAFEPEQAPLDRSRGRLEQSIGRAVARGLLAHAAPAHLSISPAPSLRVPGEEALCAAGGSGKR